jgi:aspartate dehydrogenase
MSASAASATPLRVGLLGGGAIGQAVISYAANYPDELSVAGVLCRRDVPEGVTRVDTLDALLALTLDVVVEATGHAGVREHGAAVLASGRELLIVSVGALADVTLEQELRTAARSGGGRLIIASGAIGALDALAAAAVGGLEQVTHTTRKPPRSLLPPDEADALRAPRELFNGSAREAALLFPESVNVAAAVSLAGLGFDRTTVRVIADPAVERNVHQVEAAGAFGRFQFEIHNVPSAANPRSARLAAMSIVQTLRRRGSWLVVG